MARKTLTALLLMLAIVTPGTANAQSKRKRTRRTPRISSLPSTSVQTSTQSVTPGAFTIGAGRYAYFMVATPRSATMGVLQGRFRAQGGSGNDVEVFLLDADGFENFQNGHRVNTLYNSGRVTVGNISAYINPSMVYYLVFSNVFSTFTNKAITAEVILTYEQQVLR
jgi:hypothetical protein